MIALYQNDAVINETPVQEDATTAGLPNAAITWPQRDRAAGIRS
jgi:hypothetical protein